jgi:uncharacterized protein
MAQHKIIFTGPVGAGKTTAIQSISDVPIMKTDASAKEFSKERGASTTVAMDYGIIVLDDGERIHLYGTPGEERFNFMWDILLTGGIGLILLINNSSVDPLKDMRFFLKAFEKFIGKTAIAIGVTQMDKKNKPTISDYHAQFASTNMNPPIFEIDARVKSDVSLLVQALLYSLDSRIEK